MTHASQLRFCAFGFFHVWLLGDSNASVLDRRSYSISKRKSLLIGNHLWRNVNLVPVTMEGKAAASPSSLGQMVKDTVEPSPAPAPLNVSIMISPRKEKLNESEEEEEDGDDAQRGQWLRAAVLGANDGLVTTASLMMGMGGVDDAKTMVLSGLAALVAGSCSMAVGEYVSVQTQRDVELSSLNRKKRVQQAFERSTSRTLSPSSGTTDIKDVTHQEVISSSEKEKLPNPAQAAFASGLSFTAGALVPLLSAAFITEYYVRVGVLIGIFTVALLSFGALGAYLGRASVVKGSLRVLIGGWIAMSITFGILKLSRSIKFEDDDEKR